MSEKPGRFGVRLKCVEGRGAGETRFQAVETEPVATDQPHGVEAETGIASSGGAADETFAAEPGESFADGGGGQAQSLGFVQNNDGLAGGEDAGDRALAERT
jgi:hypothetical protein